MTDRYGSQDPARRIKALVVVLLLHAVLVYVLVSGMARDDVPHLRQSLQAVVIQEVILPPLRPPPPAPPQLKKTELPKPLPKAATPPPWVPPPDVMPAAASVAPPSVSTPASPPMPLAMLPAPSPAPLLPPALAPTRARIGVACPTQIAPEMPRKALFDGVEGVVKAQALIADGVVKEVTILSGPRVFHDVVRQAMLQYKCNREAGEVLATQEFVFKLE